MSQIKKFEGKSAKIFDLLKKGLDVKKVMERAKCTDSEVYRVKNSAIFQDSERSEALILLGGEAAKVAIRTLLEVARNKNAASQARVSAADKLLHYTGIKLDSEGNIEKTPANMTAAELHNRLAELQKEAMSRAKPVNIIEGEVVKDKSNDVDELLN